MGIRFVIQGFRVICLGGYQRASQIRYNSHAPTSANKASVTFGETGRAHNGRYSGYIDPLFGATMILNSCTSVIFEVPLPSLRCCADSFGKSNLGFCRCAPING